MNIMENSVDRISGLSNSSLVHILSFLPVKEAVATSLLSKRWRLLWLSLHTLYLYSGDFHRYSFFRKFVNKMLKLVDLKSVKKIVLVFPYTCRHFGRRKVSKWINAVINISSKVEHLELHLGSKNSTYKLPSRVFTANNIRVLKLSDVTVGRLSRADLPSLEVLHLKGVDFLEDIRSLEMLLNACPLLQELALRFSYVLGYHPLNIGRFNHLVTAEVPQSLIPLEVFSNATFLRFVNECTKQVMCPLTFSDDIPMFNNLTHLECVADEWTKMVNRLENFPKLEKLVIGKICFSSSPPEPILSVPPCVSSHLKEFILHCFEGYESECEMVKFMVENAGVLRTVYICGGLPLLQYEPSEFGHLAPYFKLGSESWSRMHQQPLILMISS